jgi:hypothetical protein
VAPKRSNAASIQEENLAENLEENLAESQEEHLPHVIHAAALAQEPAREQEVVRNRRINHAHAATEVPVEAQIAVPVEAPNAAQIAAPIAAENVRRNAALRAVQIAWPINVPRDCAAEEKRTERIRDPQTLRGAVKTKAAREAPAVLASKEIAAALEELPKEMKRVQEIPIERPHLAVPIERPHLAVLIERPHLAVQHEQPHHAVPNKHQHREPQRELPRHAFVHRRPVLRYHTLQICV